METSNERKNRLLGMPYGTATGKLRKMLLFDFAKRLNEDNCYRCGTKIETIEEFSIEHTIPWQSAQNPIETFYDLSKIAYSHLSCNTIQSSSVWEKGVKFNRLKKIAPEGTSWCFSHQAFLPLEKFTRNRFRENGLDVQCKECRSKIRSCRTRV